MTTPLVKSGNKKNKIITQLEAWYGYIIALVIAFMISDLTILNVREFMVPNQAPPAKPKRMNAIPLPDRSSYNSIITKNVFSLDGVIPDQLVPKGEEGKQKEEVPVPSSLPLNLIGTIVHSNPAKSIATIEVKSKNQTLSFGIKKEIEGMATVEKIDRGHVVFRNLNSGRLEFIEMKTATKLNFGLNQQQQSSTDIKQIGKNKFEIRKADLAKHLSDLPNLLQQARSAPHINPATGEVDGFTLIDFSPDSIFTELNIPKMSVLKKVNGEAINSPAKALELFNALKNSDTIQLEYENGGKSEKLTYKIR